MCGQVTEILEIFKDICKGGIWRKSKPTARLAGKGSGHQESGKPRSSMWHNWHILAN